MITFIHMYDSFFNIRKLQSQIATEPLIQVLDTWIFMYMWRWIHWTDQLVHRYVNVIARLHIKVQSKGHNQQTHCGLVIINISSYLVKSGKNENSDRSDAWNENFVRNWLRHHSLLHKQSSRWDTKDVQECFLCSYTSESWFPYHLFHYFLEFCFCQFLVLPLMMVLHIYMPFKTINYTQPHHVTYANSEPKLL